MDYTLKDLEKDLKRLNKKTEELSNWLEKQDNSKTPINYMDKSDLTEKIIAPIYIVEMTKYYMKFLGIKTNEFQLPIEDDEKQER